MHITIEQPGLHSSIQDLGRIGHRASGVSVGGAVDSIAARIANLIVGNPENTPVIECAIAGPTLQFSQPTVIAICGATPPNLPSWQAIFVNKNDTITIKQIARGNYAYIAIAGGIDVPNVLDSCSTELRAGFGGFKGRLLKAGDRLLTPKAQQLPKNNHWSINHHELYHIENTNTIRIISGSESDEYGKAWTNRPFKVTAQSNRMGIRLSGQKLLRKSDAELQSSPVTPGTIQVPPDGQPIVLLADAQTMGGYPKIGHVASVDLPRLAQLRAGEDVRFSFISLAEAHALKLQQEHHIAMVRYALSDKMRPA